MTTKLKGQHLHFDPLSGIAGDMTVGALVDAGVPRDVITGAIAAMKVPGLQVGFEKRTRGAFVGTGFVVTWEGMTRAKERPVLHIHGRKKVTAKAHVHDHDHDHGHDHGHDDHDHDHVDHGHEHANDHRSYADIKKLLKAADLDGEARKLAADIFHRIAVVEGELHGVPTEKVSFHEVGAYDSIADVVGAAAGLAWLEPSGVTATAPVIGTGTVRTAHGRVAVPAPATAALLRGVAVRPEGEGELTTPTGAGILVAVVREFRALPPIALQAQGFGAGTRELADRPNVLRLMVGTPVGKALPAAETQVVLLQANLDDMSPQLIDPLMGALFEAGALDVWVTSILMKKGRPGVEISALAPPGASEALARAYFENSTTLGVRQSLLDRRVLARSADKVETRFGVVPVKIAALDGQVLGASPEFDDCRRLAARAKVPVREVIAEATAAARRFLPSPSAAPEDEEPTVRRALPSRSRREDPGKRGRR